MRREDPVLLRRDRDTMDRDYAQPLDAMALARFAELVGESPSAYRARNHHAGSTVPPCIDKVRTRPIRNGEAEPIGRPLA